MVFEIVEQRQLQTVIKRNSQPPATIIMPGQPSNYGNAVSETCNKTHTHILELVLRTYLMELYSAASVCVSDSVALVGPRTHVANILRS